MATRELKATATEKEKYVLKTAKDYKILQKCKLVEKLNLKREDKHLTKLIKKQLRKDWRIPLLQELNRIIRKYNKRE